jgi:integrase
MLYATDGRRPLAPKTVLEIHLIIRGALQDAVARGLVNRNVALVAHAPKLRSIPKVEQKSWTAQQLQAFLQAAAGHRLFPAFWLLASTGMRRSELLGLQWDDVDFKKARVSVNRGLVSVAYELHESLGKTPNSRRAIDLDPTTIKVLKALKDWQRAEQEAAGVESEGWVFTSIDGKPVHHSISQTFERISARAGVPRIRPRHPPHSRHAAHQSRSTGQGGFGATGSCEPGVHHRHLPARPPRYASRARTFEKLINEARPGTAGRRPGRRTA